MVIVKESDMKYSEFLKENYHVLLEIFNCMRTGIWITDGTGEVLMVNDESMKAGGLLRDEVIGKNMVELVEMGYITESSALNAIANDREEMVIEEMGEGGYCVATSVPLKYRGKIDLIICIERDISEVVNLRNALHEQKEIADKIRESLYKANIDIDQESDEMIVNSYKMIRVEESAQRIGSLDATTIILGESGTGKEKVAELIYEYSKRVGKPFIKVNCAAIPESLIESELFGYEGGAFTGAKSGGAKGMFEEADGGTIFLDEIGELPLSMQSKLLRVLENGEIRRVGGTESKAVDVRIIAATNRNLKKEVEAGRFRDDLYYRLMVLPIVIPPLRERKDDILPLARMFLTKFNSKYHLNKELTESAIKELSEYKWPGNVRELKNMMERLVVSAGGDEISGFQVKICIMGIQEGAESSADVNMENATLAEIMDNYEKQIITEAIEECGTMSAAAAKLGVNKSTISRKIKAYEEKVAREGR